MKEFDKRITALQKKVERAAAARARYEPFSIIRVKSIFNDKAVTVFYPHGIGSEKEMSAVVTIPEAFREARGTTFVHMDFCPEWSHCFYASLPDYTDEQKIRFKEEDLRKYPEIAVIYDSPDPEEFIKVLSGIPQSFRVGKGVKKCNW